MVWYLEDTLLVAGWLDTQVLLHLLIPHLGEILDLSFAAHDTPLGLKSEDHMHGVSDLHDSEFLLLGFCLFFGTSVCFFIHAYVYLCVFVCVFVCARARA